jgi:flagellar M-ring protein FliF
MLALQRELEQRYTERIESMLERVLGPGHALARVTVALDLAQVEKTEESFDPDRVAVRNEKRSREKSAAGVAASGVPGVSATLTNEPAPVAPDDGPTSEREDSSLNYEISRVTSRRVEAMGAIRKLSVAVLLDGSYTGEGEARAFVPRPAEEIDRYRELVKRAVGFNEERGDDIEVASAPFQTATTLAEPEAPPWTSRLAAWSDVLWRGAALAAIVVVAITVVRPVLLALASRVPAPLPSAASAAGGELRGLPPGTPRVAIEAAQPSSEQAAQVIRQWLATE